MDQLFKRVRAIKFIVLLSVFVFSSLWLWGEKAPRINVKENSWDFGKVDQGEVLTHVFSITNEGGAPLVINRVRTTCGCTAAVVSDKKIEPGKSGKIEVTLNTRGYEGRLSKDVFIETNDPEQPQAQLTVTASIDVPPRPRIDLDHYSLDVGLLLDTEEIQAKAKIMNRGQLELSVECSHKDAVFFSQGEKAAFPLKIPAGKEAEIEIRLSPRPRKGLMREYILVKSNDPYRQSLSLYLSGYVISKEQLKALFAKYKDVID